MTLEAGVVEGTTEGGVTDVQSAADALEARWSGEEAEQASDPKPEAEEVKAQEGVVEPEVEGADAPEESDDQAPDEVDEDVQFESVEQLAEALDMKPEEFLASIKAQAKVDGESVELSLSELQAGYQREADYTRKTQQLAELRKQAETEITAEREKVSQMHQELSNLVQLNEQALLQEYQSVNWQQLRIEDPAEFAARELEFRARNDQIQQWRQMGTQKWQEQMQELEQKQVEEQKKRLETEAQSLVEAIPEWMDQEKAKAGKQAVADYLLGAGFSPEEAYGVSDHRAVVLARKAMLYDQASGKAEVAKKKVKDLPKVLKPGTRRSQSQKLAEARQKLRKNLKKTGSLDDAAAIILDRM